MTATLDNNIVVSISGDAPPVTAAGFGVPLYVPSPGTLAVGFTERTRIYASPSDASGDTDLSASARAALAAAFGQSPRVGSIIVGRMDAGTAQISDITIAGTVLTGEIFTVVVNGTSIVHTAGGTPTPTTVAAALVVLADAAFPAEFSNGATVGVMDVEHATGSVPFTVEVSTDSAGGTIVASINTAASDPSDEMDLILADNGTWYTLHTEEIGAGFVLDLAAWMESNDRQYITAINAADALTSSTTDVCSALKGLSYSRTSTIYHLDDALCISLSWAAKTLQANPDQTTTTWFGKTLSGHAADSITPTAKANLQGKNCNVYLTFYGFPTTDKGVLASGEWIDVQLTKDWAKARIEENLANLFLSVANRNSKIPFTDGGIQQVASVVSGVLSQVEGAGHFVSDSSTVTAPLAKDVSPGDLAARSLSLTFVTQLAGAIHNVAVTGSVLLTLPG